MRVSSKAAGSLRVSSTANEVRLRFPNITPVEAGAVYVELNETEAPATSECAWGSLNKDVLRLVASHVSPEDRSKMRLVCHQWSRQVSVTDNDAERIARGRNRKRAQRIANVTCCVRRMRVPCFALMTTLALVFLIAGIVLITEAEVPELWNLKDSQCSFDSPRIVVALPFSLVCCKNCDKVVRYRGAISVNNGSAALHFVSEKRLCGFETAAIATNEALSYLRDHDPVVPCVSRGLSLVSIAVLANAKVENVYDHVLWLDKSRSALESSFVKAICMFSLLPVVIVLGMGCLCTQKLRDRIAAG